MLPRSSGLSYQSPCPKGSAYSLDTPTPAKRTRSLWGRMEAFTRAYSRPGTSVETKSASWPIAVPAVFVGGETYAPDARSVD